MGCGGTKAAQVAPADGAADSVGELLQRNGLGQYREKMQELGWDDLEHLSTMDSRRLKQVAERDVNNIHFSAGQLCKLLCM